MTETKQFSYWTRIMSGQSAESFLAAETLELSEEYCDVE
jgi:hypothetical protein